MSRKVSQPRRRGDLGRINVFRPLLRRVALLDRRAAGSLHAVVQLRRNAHLRRAEVGHKGRIHNRSVFISHFDVCDHAVQPVAARQQRKYRQRRAEKEKSDLMCVVKVHDLRQDRKRRIVDNDRAVRIRHFLIVPARIERPHDGPPLQSVFPNRPRLHGLVHGRGRVAVVRCLLRLEFLNKRRVLFGILARFGCRHTGFKSLGGLRRSVLFRLGCLFLRPCFCRFLTHGPGQRRRIIQQHRRGVKAGHREVFARVAHLAQLQREHFRIPAGQLRQPVVCQDVRAPLALAQMLHQHARHLGHTFGFRRQHPAVPRNDIPVAVDQYRIDKTELAQARPELRDLALAVRSRVPRIRHQLADRHAHQLLRHKPRRGQVSRPRRADAFLSRHV